MMVLFVSKTTISTNKAAARRRGRSLWVVQTTQRTSILWTDDDGNFIHCTYKHANRILLTSQYECRKPINCRSIIRKHCNKLVTVSLKINQLIFASQKAIVKTELFAKLLQNYLYVYRTVRRKFVASFENLNIVFLYVGANSQVLSCIYRENIRHVYLTNPAKTFKVT